MLSSVVLVWGFVCLFLLFNQHLIALFSEVTGVQYFGGNASPVVHKDGVAAAKIDRVETSCF